MTGNRCPQCGRARNPDGNAGPGCDCAKRVGAALRAEREADVGAAQEFDPLRIRPYVTLEGLRPPGRPPSDPSGASQPPGVSGPACSTPSSPDPAGDGGLAPDAAGGSERAAHEDTTPGGARRGAAGPHESVDAPAVHGGLTPGNDAGKEAAGPPVPTPAAGRAADGRAYGTGPAAAIPPGAQGHGVAPYGGALPPEEAAPPLTKAQHGSAPGGGHGTPGPQEPTGAGAHGAAGHGATLPPEEFAGTEAHHGFAPRAAGHGATLPPEEFGPDGSGARRGGDDTVVLAPVGSGPGPGGQGHGGEEPPRRRRLFAGLAVGAAAVAVAGTAAFAGGLFSGGEEQDRALPPDTRSSAPTDSAVSEVPSQSASASTSASASASSSASAAASASASASPSRSASPRTSPGTGDRPAVPSAPRTTAQETGTVSEAPSGKPAGGTLRRGDSGAAVVDLQQRLKQVGLYPYDEADGRFDEDVEQAVKAYQWDRDVQGDPLGVYGPRTRRALEAETRSS